MCVDEGMCVCALTNGDNIENYLLSQECASDTCIEGLNFSDLLNSTHEHHRK